VSVSIVARRYATALLEIGVESGQLEAIANDLSRVAETYDASSDLRNAVENPLVAHAAKRAVVDELCEKLGANPVVKNTLGLMVDRRRMQTLPYVARYLRELSDARKGLLRAEVTTATPMSEDYYTRLQAQLEKLTGKKVALDRKTDPTIIAGVVTRIGDRVFDGSIRTRLVSMKDALMPHPN
jgi:F-type H+-transporting ATPase subunit delta